MKEAARYWQKQEFRRSQAEKARSRGQVFVDNKMSFLPIPNDPNGMLKHFTSLLQDKAGAIHRSTQDFAVVIICNWIAPSTIKSAVQKLQSDFLGSVMATELGKQCMGVILMPMTCSKAGRLWLTEMSCMKLLGESGVAFDTPFTLLFQERNSRDERPLAYNGRIAFPSGMSLHKSIFAKTKLVQENITNAANHLPGNCMVTVEDMSDTALPASVDAPLGGGYHLARAPKFAQVGPEAMEKLLAASAVQLKDVAAMMIVDLNTNVGDLAKAFVSTASEYTIPTFSCHFSQTATESEYARMVAIDAAIPFAEQGKLKMPLGHESGVISMEPAADVAITLPDPPVLRVLQVNNQPDSQVGISIFMPEQLKNTWYEHKDQRLRDLFRSGLKRIEEDQVVTVSLNPPPSKKRAAEDDPQQPDPKRSVKQEIQYKTFDISEYADRQVLSFATSESPFRASHGSIPTKMFETVYPEKCQNDNAQNKH